MVAPEEVQTRFVSLGWQYLGLSAIPDGIEAISAQLLEDVLVFYKFIVRRSSRCRNLQAISQAQACAGSGTQPNYNTVSATLV